MKWVRLARSSGAYTDGRLAENLSQPLPLFTSRVVSLPKRERISTSRKAPTHENHHRNHPIAFDAVLHEQKLSSALVLTDRITLQRGLQSDLARVARLTHPHSTEN